MIVSIGDLHYRSAEPYVTAKRMFGDWVAKQQEWNRPDVTALVLGDVANKPRDDGLVNGEVVHFFERILQMNEIHVLTGNHEASYREGNFLDAIKPISGVTVYEDISKQVIDGHTFLLLPYIRNCYELHGMSMKELYENLHINNPEYLEGVEFVSGHFADETQTMWGDYIDISNIPGTRIMGDIHLPSAHYPGTPVINRKDEAGKPNHLWFVPESGEVGRIEVPRFLDFVEVEYGKEVKVDGVEVPYLIVKNAPSEESVEEHSFYSNHFIHSVTVTSESTGGDGEGSSDAIGEEMNYAQLLEDYVQENPLPSDALARARSRLLRQAPSPQTGAVEDQQETHAVQTADDSLPEEVTMEEAQEVDIDFDAEFDNATGSGD